jgi:hypothetical protein
MQEVVGSTPILSTIFLSCFKVPKGAFLLGLFSLTILFYPRPIGQSRLRGSMKPGFAIHYNVFICRTPFHWPRSLV